MSRPRPLFEGFVLWLFGGALAAWLGAQAWLTSRFGLPALGPSILTLAAFFLCVGWGWVEGVETTAEGRAWLKAAGPGLVLAALGQALCYPHFEPKEALAPLGLGLLAVGLALLWPRQRGALPKAVLLAAVLLALLGWGVWLGQGHLDWDFFGALGKSHGLVGLWWGLALLVFVGLALLAARRPALAALKEEPLSRRQEAWGLAAALAAGALIRFWQAGQLPQNYWYDEFVILQGVQDNVIGPNAAPLYILGLVQNPGAYFWVMAAAMRAFGENVEVLRVTAGAFGLLAMLPFWALARTLLGQRWALAATFAFAVMRWVVIPQRIAFMTGFATFWLLTAFWALWWAWARGRSGPAWKAALRWGLAGFLLGANLHTYIPGRAVPLAAFAFLGLQALTQREWRLKPVAWLALGAGFLLSAGPMLLYLLQHWQEYTGRMKDVSLYGDAQSTGRPFWPQFWSNVQRHALMFNVKGDFNARHNVHFMPQLDGLLALVFAIAAPWTLGRAFSDARARFLWVWILPMLAAGVLSITSEAPQAHRTILAAPALVLMAALGLRELLPSGRAFFGGAPPMNFKAAGLVLLLGLAVSNLHAVLKVWPAHEATYRSFSPRASAVVRRMRQEPPGTYVMTSTLEHEYQFTGSEWTLFARETAAQLGQGWNNLAPKHRVPEWVGAQAVSQVLLFWGDSDKAFDQALRAQFPDLAVERPKYPFADPDQPEILYNAMRVPMTRVPVEPEKGPAPFLCRSHP